MLEFLIPLIAFSGLIFGILLSKISPEEMKSGKKYFNYLKKIALAVLVISLIFLTAPFSWYVLLGLIIGYISALLLKRVYFFLGLALLLSFLTFNPNFTLLVSSLIFIFGLPLGSLINMELKKRKDIYHITIRQSEEDKRYEVNYDTENNEIRNEILHTILGKIGKKREFK